MSIEQISEVLRVTGELPLSGAGISRIRSLVRMYTSIGDVQSTQSYDDVQLRSYLSCRVSTLMRHLLVSVGGVSYPFSSSCSRPLSCDLLSPGSALEELSRLTFGFSLSFHGPWHDECRTLCLRLLPSLLSSGSSSDELSALSIILYMYGSASGDVSSLDIVRLYLGVCRRWVDSMVDEPVPLSPSPWPGLSTEHSVRRLGLLLDGVHVFGDRSLSSPADALYSSLRSVLSFPSPPMPSDVPLAFAWHDLLSSPWCPAQDEPLRLRLSCLLEERSRRVAPLSDMWHMCIAPSVCDSCASLLQSGSLPESA